MKRFLSIFVNDRAFTCEGEWQHLAPYGVHAHPLGRQKVSREAAQKLKLALNEAKSKAGAGWRGVPIFVGHPPSRGGSPEQKAKDFPRIGAVMNIDVREDGPWVQVAWNDLGQKNASEGHYVYPSPAWHFDKNADGSISPIELDHVGMTNDPRIDTRPWTNEADPDSETENDITMTKETIARLRAALNLKEDADGDAICNALTTKLADIAANETKVTEKVTLATNAKTAAETALTSEKSAREVAENSLKDARKAHATTLLDIAINEGRITAAQRPDHAAAFDKDFAAASTALAAIKKTAINTKPLEVDIAGAKRSIATNEERREVISTAVNDRMVNDKVGYDEAYRRVKGDKKFAAVFEAMEQPAHAKDKAA
jgi:hypothetical protein